MAHIDENGWLTTALRTFTSPNRWSGNRGRAAIVMHITDGTDSRGWLCNPASQVSAHFLIRDEGIYQLVSLHDSAWANGIWQPGHRWRGIPESENPNRWTVSIEREGRPFQPVSAAIERHTIDLLRILSAHYSSFRPLAPGVNFIGHVDISPKHRPNCPGPTVDFAQLAAQVNGDAPAPAPETGETLVVGVPQQRITLDVFLDVCTRRNFGASTDELRRIYTLCDWLGVCAAFVVALTLSEQGDYLDQSARFRETRNWGNIIHYTGTPHAMYTDPNGRRYVRYESSQIGGMALVLRLKDVYGYALGLRTVEQIIPTYLNDPNYSNDARINRILTDMQYMTDAGG